MTAGKLFTAAAIIFLNLLPAAPAARSADAGPPAADLVADGQLIDLKSGIYAELFAELIQSHAFSPDDLNRLFKEVAIRKRVLELMDQQWEDQPYYVYQPKFVTTEMVENGRQMLRLHRELLDRIEEKIGVERAIIVAIWGIETRYGSVEGSFNVFRTLNTLFDAYPRRRSFARQQLIHFLLLCRENNVDPLSVMGSYAGAFGQTQFIPSSFREYAVDFDGDGRRDIWRSVEDVLASIANYLQRAGWVYGTPVYCELGPELKDESLAAAYRKGRKGFVPWQNVAKAQGVKMIAPPANRDITIVGLELNPETGGGMRYVAAYPNFQAITAWNHSNRYAMAVTELAEALSAKP